MGIQSFYYLGPVDRQGYIKFKIIRGKTLTLSSITKNADIHRILKTGKPSRKHNSENISKYTFFPQLVHCAYRRSIITEKKNCAGVSFLSVCLLLCPLYTIKATYEFFKNVLAINLQFAKLFGLYSTED